MSGHCCYGHKAGFVEECVDSQLGQPAGVKMSTGVINDRERGDAPRFSTRAIAHVRTGLLRTLRGMHRQYTLWAAGYLARFA